MMLIDKVYKDHPHKLHKKDHVKAQVRIKIIRNP